MRSNFRTTIATYCLLSIAGGVSFIMPDSIEPPPPPQPVPRMEPATRPEAKTTPEDDPAREAEREAALRRADPG